MARGMVAGKAELTRHNVRPRWCVGGLLQFGVQGGYDQVHEDEAWM